MPAESDRETPDLKVSEPEDFPPSAADVEQAIRALLQQFVFATNDSRTWTSVIAVVTSYLRDLWTRGGLLGDSAAEAFQVECGLGTTMTAEDVRQGYLNVQVTLQLERPAEFIELTIRQQLLS